MTWPRTVGKAVQDYLEEVAPPLDEKLFTNDVRAYLRAQRFSEQMDPETIAILFKITTEFLKARTAVSSMMVAQIEKDWRARKQLIKRLQRHLVEIRRLTHPRLDAESRPLRNLVAESVRKKITFLLHEVDQVAQFQRLEQSAFATLQRSTRGTNAYVLELNAQLKHRFPQLHQRERDLVIAGTMIASKIRTDSSGHDSAANLPMARSRACRAFRDDLD
jgi:wyosine [tRNA(Phe)-imidazoG37] synthetase (radical SAM superfamily)